MGKKQETKFSIQVQAELKKIPQCYFFKTNEMSRRGVPDIIGCVNGHFFALELKEDGGVEAPLQKVILERISKAAGYALFVYPKNLPNVISRLFRLSRQPFNEL